MVKGKVYDCIGREHGWYRIIDESGEDYLYPPDVIEEVVNNHIEGTVDAENQY